MMETVLRLAIGAGLGLAVGSFFFGTLWLTVRRLEETVHPHRMLVVSFLGRAAVALGAFYLMAREGTGMLLAAAAGFLTSRALLIRYLAPKRRVAP